MRLMVQRVDSLYFRIHFHIKLLLFIGKRVRIMILNGRWKGENLKLNFYIVKIENNDWKANWNWEWSGTNGSWFIAQSPRKFNSIVSIILNQCWTIKLSRSSDHYWLHLCAIFNFLFHWIPLECQNMLPC